MGGTPKVTVAGAGALGLATALALADAGCAVTVCDPAEPAANASGVAAGMLAPVFEAVLDPAARPHLDLLLAARDLWPGLAQRAGIALDRSGALAAGSDPWLAELEARFAGLGLHAAEIATATAQTMAPGLSGDFRRALLSREDWRLDARAALAQLRAAAQAAGVVFRPEAARRGGTDILVIATGPSQALAEAAPELAALSPIKGHILRVQAPWAWGATVRGEAGYAAPGEGVMMVGATMEPGVAEPAPDPGRAPALIEAGARLFPALADASCELLAGVRAATPDGLPLVGFSAALGVVVAAGARRNGWLLAPLAAQVVAACVTGREPGPHAARLDPRRFEGDA